MIFFKKKIPYIKYYSLFIPQMVVAEVVVGMVVVAVILRQSYQLRRENGGK